MPNNTAAHEVGVVVKTKRYLVTISGLPSARVNDIIVNQSGQRAIIRSLSNEYVFALSLEGVVHMGDRYQFLKNKNLYTVDESLFGRVIDTLGRPIDNHGSFGAANTPLRLEVEAPGIEVRQPIHDQLYTGITAVDTLIPIAKGQRQLIFGPMRSGKTAFLTETTLAQAKAGTVCIYAVIGKPINGLRKITDHIMKNRSQAAKTIVIAASSDEPAPVIALAPSVAFLLAEVFQSQGEDVLVILDDLDAHAKYLREIALLEGRLPSTESYPGDIFYQHAHLMERSGHFTEAIGGGSITTLPVIETDQKNFSDLIPTNLMACTDGHLAFAPRLRAEGIYPPISIEQSVTRVGRQAQVTVQKQMTRRVQRLLGEYRTQKEYAQFSADLSKHAKQILTQGRIMESLLQQPPYQYRDVATQILVLGLVFTDLFTDQPDWYQSPWRERLVTTLSEHQDFAELRQMAMDDNSSWPAFITALDAKCEKLIEYVSTQ